MSGFTTDGIMKKSAPYLILGLATVILAGSARIAAADPPIGDPVTPVFGSPVKTPGSKPRTPASHEGSSRPAHIPTAAPLPPEPIAPSSIDDAIDGAAIPPTDLPDDAPWRLATSIKLGHNPVSVGPERIVVSVTDPATGEPVTHLMMRVTASRIGEWGPARQPVVNELGKGRYGFVVDFATRGAWKVSLRGGDREKGVVLRDLTFSAGSKRRWVEPVDAAPLEGQASPLDAQ